MILARSSFKVRERAMVLFSLTGAYSTILVALSIFLYRLSAAGSWNLLDFLEHLPECPQSLSVLPQRPQDSTVYASLVSEVSKIHLAHVWNLFGVMLTVRFHITWGIQRKYGIRSLDTSGGSRVTQAHGQLSTARPTKCHHFTWIRPDARP